MSHYTRSASHAGSWYDGNGIVLKRQLQSWVQEGSSSSSSSGVKSVIAPHAGYSFSGPTAGYGYQALMPLTAQVRRIFILGPSHHKALSNCEVSGAGQLETPLGDLTVDEEVRASLLSIKGGLFARMACDVDETEHSIEMHLPYIRLVIESAPDPSAVTVVPIMVGQLREQGGHAQRTAAALLPYYKDTSSIFIISSDFCHWGRRFRYSPFDQDVCSEIFQYIELLDKRAIELILAQDRAGFLRYLEETSNTICGRFPISLLLGILELGGIEHGSALTQYRQSGQVRDASDSSVSYASIVFRD